MNVSEHRTPLRRIEIGSAPADKRRQSEVTEAMSGVGPTERARIWWLVEQTSRGVNRATEPDAPDGELGGVPVPDDIAEVVRSWLMGGDGA